jgi:hypothetical protein
MKKLIAATLFAFALSTHAFAFDLGGIDGIPSDMKDTIAKQSGGRITNKAGQQAGQQGQQQSQQQSQQQAGQDGQQQQGGRKARQARKSQKGSMQSQAMQGMQSLMGDDSDIGSSVGSFMGR